MQDNIGDQAGASDPQPSRGMTIAWPVVTTILGTLSLALFVTVIVILTIKDVDTLSTVALALAVLSFAAQLIVTMAQAQQATQVSGETKSALADMRATTASLLTNQRGQFDTVLKALVRQAVPAAIEDVTSQEPTGDQAEDASALESALESRLKEAIKNNWLSSAGAVSTGTEVEHNDRVRRVQRTAEWSNLLETWPTQDEGERVAEILRGLPIRSIQVLGGFIANVRTRIQTLSVDKEPTVYVHWPEADGRPAAYQRLIDSGLIEVVSTSTNRDRKVFERVRLTPDGVIAARLLSAKGQPPEWAADIAAEAVHRSPA
ncbi:hypothetical protein [Mycobacterium sp. NPDC004974]